MGYVEKICHVEKFLYMTDVEKSEIFHIQRNFRYWNFAKCREISNVSTFMTDVKKYYIYPFLLTNLLFAIYAVLSRFMRFCRWPLILPTSGLPTGRQSWGRQFWVHQSSGLPTLIMKTYFDMFWTIHAKYNRLRWSSTVCNTFPIFWDQFNSSLITYHNLSLPRNSVLQNFLIWQLFLLGSRITLCPDVTQ